MEEEIVFLSNLYTVVWGEIVFHRSVICSYYQPVKPHLYVFISEAWLFLTKHFPFLPLSNHNLHFENTVYRCIFTHNCKRERVGGYFFFYNKVRYTENAT